MALVDPLVTFSFLETANITDVPGYSDTVYSDTPLTVTLWAGPKSFINRLSVYSDTNIC